MHELCLQDQLAYIAAFIPFEPGTGRDCCRQDLLSRNAIHVPLGAVRERLVSLEAPAVEEDAMPDGNVQEMRELSLSGWYATLQQY